ncbi:hypothetical protein [Anaeromyxobacter sp. K]|uniref:hypothetical protein n=1 Tax=Anaeromyxobacter sp. (strain K) TaxID=447217 RepID=UPI0012FB4BC4|nr:hypothetical protein [Anaeromyxobacter sp. K]
MSIAYLSYGGELRVGFGALSESRRGYINGEWTLGTRGSPWLLEREGRFTASERDAEGTWAASLEVLKGRLVERVRLDVPGPDLSLELEGGYRYSILPSKQPEWQAWELLCPDGSTVVAWCNGRWVERQRGEADEEG